MPREGLDVILRTGEPWRVSSRRGQEDTWRGQGQRHGVSPEQSRVLWKELEGQREPSCALPTAPRGSPAGVPWGAECDGRTREPGGAWPIPLLVPPESPSGSNGHSQRGPSRQSKKLQCHRSMCCASRKDISTVSSAHCDVCHSVLLFQEIPGTQWHSHASDLVSEAQTGRRLRDPEAPLGGIHPSFSSPFLWRPRGP